jgi:hypothetical protein
MLAHLLSPLNPLPVHLALAIGNTLLNTTRTQPMPIHLFVFYVLLNSPQPSLLY